MSTRVDILSSSPQYTGLLSKCLNMPNFSYYNKETYITPKTKE
ncbi:hypothetical protein B4168_4145 [Anoxybacillus flavithermus]|nr:hypothetical protein B4168_4145 [Anoxybacillus flavithermus]OAO86007.1 hypothetical protein GT23_2347 [Parageobacillus thermoglucosidasius]